MRRLARFLLVTVLLWNVGLVVTSLWLVRQSERAHPPIGHFIEVDGSRLHVRDSGPTSTTTTPPLLLLHGASTSLLDFEHPLRPALEARHRVISIDRPGHGYSERTGDWADPYRQARLARGVLDALGIERAVWIGHSWSGAVVLAAMLDERAHVAAGVLIAGVTHPWEGERAWHVELSARPLLGRLFAWQYIAPIGRTLLGPSVAAAFAPEPVPRDYIERTGLTLSLRPRAYRANARDLTRLGAHLRAQAARYAAIDQPLLSLVGSADSVVPPAAHDERLGRALPSRRSVTFEEAGHAFHHTRAARVVAEIEAFVANLPDP